eukprot:COSAG02_NODE_3126_length_7316_cov_100.271997_6_plen_95_part_00
MLCAVWVGSAIYSENAKNRSITLIVALDLLTIGPFSRSKRSEGQNTSSQFELVRKRHANEDQLLQSVVVANSATLGTWDSFSASAMHSSMLPFM